MPQGDRQRRASGETTWATHAGRPPANTRVGGAMTERRRFLAKPAGGGGGRRRRPRRRSQRHRPAQDPVAHVDDLASGARHPAGLGPATGEGRRGDERRAVPDRGLPGRPDHAAVRLLRRHLQGHHRGVHGLAALLGGQGARARVVRDHPVRHESRGHGRLVLPGRRAQALGGGVRRLQPRAAPRPWRSPRRWPDGSGRRSTRSATTRGSRCASPNLGGKVVARAGGHDGAHARPPRSTPRSSGA